MDHAGRPRAHTPVLLESRLTIRVRVKGKNRVVDVIGSCEVESKIDIVRALVFFYRFAAFWRGALMIVTRDAAFFLVVPGPVARVK